MNKNIWLNYSDEPKLEKRPIMLDLCSKKEILSISFLSRESISRGIKVTFDNVLTYRETNESFVLSTIFSLYEQGRIDEKFDANSWVFLAKQSQLLDWIHEETEGIYKDHSIKHFIFISSEYITDVVSFDDPIITVE